jgi:hypothetical protein
MAAIKKSRGPRAERTPLRVAIVGVGNCASSLVQGASFYRDADPDRAVGLMHWEIGGYEPGDLEVAAAFDVDLRKVGKDVAEAIFEKPNCTAVFCDRVPKTGVRVRMGRVLDGVSDHFESYPEDRRFVVSDQKEATREEIVAELRDAEVDVLANYLPVGSERASRFYAECALEARVASGQLHPGVPRERSRVRAALRRRAACRSSATTSRPSSARRSRTGRSPTCSRSAASRSTAPTSSTRAATPTS